MPFILRVGESALCLLGSWSLCPGLQEHIRHCWCSDYHLFLTEQDPTRKTHPQNPITLENWPRVDAKWCGFRYQASYVAQFTKGPRSKLSKAEVRAGQTFSLDFRDLWITNNRNSQKPFVSHMPLSYPAINFLVTQMYFLKCFPSNRF